MGTRSIPLMNRLPVILTGIAALIASLFLMVFEPAFVSSVSRQAFDVLLRTTARPPQAHAVVMVDIDEESLSELGQWPWPRRILAELTDRLWKGGASVVVFDIVFPEEDRTSPLVAEREWRKVFGTEIRVQGIPSEKSNFDKEFAEALSRGSSILGCYMDLTAVPQTTASSDDLYRGRYFESGLSQRDLLPQALGIVSSLAAIRRSAASEAFFNTMPDSDNIIRRTPLIIAFGPDRIYPAMSIDAIRLLSDESTFRITYDNEAGRGVSDVRMHELVIPTDANGMLVLNFRSAPFPSVSAREVLASPITPDRFLNQIVFVGASAAGLRDLKATPMGAEVPGIAVHATAVDNMLAGDMLREPRWAFHANLLAAAVTGIILILLISHVRAWVGFFIAVACMVMVWAASWWCLKTWRFVFVPGGIVILTAVVYTLMTVVKFWLEERGRRRVRTMFGTMVSGDVLHYMEDHPGSFSLVGRKVEATIQFSDIMNFTTIAENVDPDVLTRLMDRYLTPMSDIIMNRMGYVDKFYGDAIMAVWGAPNIVPDHATQACLAAIDQLDRLDAMRQELAEGFGQEIGIRIGINTGDVTAGNMGSERRYQYTVMGDAVNLASRLQDANKACGTRLIISEATYLQAHDHIEVRLLGPVKVKGRSLPVKAFELLGRKGELSPRMGEVVDLYEEALDLFSRQESSICVQKLEKALTLIPDDGPSKFLLGRVRELQNRPPADAGQAFYLEV